MNEFKALREKIGPTGISPLLPRGGSPAINPVGSIGDNMKINYNALLPCAGDHGTIELAVFRLVK